MIRNAVSLAVKEIRRNVMRSALTILGIVIGVAAVIIMVTIGNGATAQVTGDIAKLGSNLLILSPGQFRHGPGGVSGGSEPFDMKDVDAIVKEIPSLAAVAPSSSQGVSAIAGNENWSTTVTGTDNEYFVTGERGLASGCRFTTGELRSGRAVCILGETVRKELFGAQDPLGTPIRLRRLSCEVIGVLEPKGQTGMGQDQDDIVLVPLKTFQRRISGNDDVQMIMISVNDGASTEKTIADIEQLMRERRRIVPGEDDDFSIQDMEEIASTLAGATRILTALLGSVAAVSLLVGGIGIMNIMLVSVTERTREIGIRLAIGALQRDVLTQFLVEAVVLSLFGGMVGIVLALGVSVVLSDQLDIPLVLDPSIMVLAGVFSAAVGVVFGYFPARRAAALDPIDALRHE